MIIVKLCYLKSYHYYKTHATPASIHSYLMPDNQNGRGTHHLFVKENLNGFDTVRSNDHKHSIYGDKINDFSLHLVTNGITGLQYSSS